MNWYKLIAVYSIDTLSRIENLQQYPFFQKALDSPGFIDALENDQRFIMHSLGWQYKHYKGVISYDLKWAESIGVWMISETLNHYQNIDAHLKYRKQKIFTHALSEATGKPVAALPFRSGIFVIKSPDHETYRINSCPNCNQPALAKEQSKKEQKTAPPKFLCAHCGNLILEGMPCMKFLEREIEILNNRNATREEKISLSPLMFSTGFLDAINRDYPEYISSVLDLLHDAKKPFMIPPRIVGAHVLLKKGAGQKISSNDLILAINQWFTKNSKIIDYTKRMMQLWISRGWLKAVGDEKYLIVLDFHPKNDADLIGL